MGLQNLIISSFSPCKKIISLFDYAYNFILYAITNTDTIIIHKIMILSKDFLWYLRTAQFVHILFTEK